MTFEHDIIKIASNKIHVGNVLVTVGFRAWLPEDTHSDFFGRSLAKKDTK